MSQTDIYASRHELDAWSDHQWWNVMNGMIDSLARGDMSGEQFDSKWEAYRAYINIPARLDQWQREKALDELTAESERLGLYDTLTLNEALNICGIERGE